MFSLIFELMIFQSQASNLPECKKQSYWTNCFGTVTSSSGNKYVGEFKDGKRDGQGTSTLSDGSKYVGEWKSGKPDGQGTLTFSSGSKYVGEFKDGQFDGQGTLTSSSGNKYVGEWKGGYKNGEGIEYYHNGSIRRQGVYKDDVFQYVKKVESKTQTNIPTNAYAYGNSWKCKSGYVIDDESGSTCKKKTIPVYSYSNKNFDNHDFSGADLQNENFKQSRMMKASFKGKLLTHLG